MNEFENVFPLLFILVIATVLAFVLYRFFKYGGVIGLVYGRRHQTIGEIDLDSRIGKHKVVIHRLEPDGLGVSRQKAHELADLLRQAAST